MAHEPSGMRGKPVCWFRRDLRLHDNVGLAAALEAHEDVVPVYAWDPEILAKWQPKNRRVTFIHDTLTTMQEDLAKRGSGLLVLQGKPEELFAENPPSHLYFNHDYEPAAIERDEAVTRAVEKAGGEVRSYKDQVIYEKDEVVKDDGDPVTVYTPYAKRWKARLTPPDVAAHDSEKWLDRLWKSEAAQLPSLTEIGFERVTMDVPPRLPDRGLVKRYDKTRDMLDIEDGTTRLGVHLRFGTTSIREAVRLAQETNETLLNELIWREFFMAILWHFPHVTAGAFRREYDAIRWENDERLFEAWKKGRTGYPVVDAGMQQLNATGFMHNRARMIVASFLTKDLLIDWRWGEQYFAEQLLDYELANNNGGWQWAAGTGCDAAPYFRIFNPELQAKKFDPSGEYAKRWIPEAGTDDYPGPVVDHKERRQRALAMYKEALG